jgi:biopolymer transport protein ExbD
MNEKNNQDEWQLILIMLIIIFLLTFPFFSSSIVKSKIEKKYNIRIDVVNTGVSFPSLSYKMQTKGDDTFTFNVYNNFWFLGYYIPYISSDDYQSSLVNHQKDFAISTFEKQLEPIKVQFNKEKYYLDVPDVGLLHVRIDKNYALNDIVKILTILQKSNIQLSELTFSFNNKEVRLNNPMSVKGKTNILNQLKKNNPSF